MEEGAEEVGEDGEETVGELKEVRKQEVGKYEIGEEEEEEEPQDPPANTADGAPGGTYPWLFVDGLSPGRGEVQCSAAILSVGALRALFWRGASNG
jgi:hypothetical protein